MSGEDLSMGPYCAGNKKGPTKEASATGNGMDRFTCLACKPESLVRRVICDARAPISPEYCGAEHVVRVPNLRPDEPTYFEIVTALSRQRRTRGAFSAKVGALEQDWRHR